MAETKVIMPQMGESIFEGTITKWLKKKGDRVERDEPLFEISTDKIDTEIPSPAAGVVQDILVKEGQTVQINTVVAVIGDGSAKAAEAPRKETPKEPVGKEPAKEKKEEQIKAGPAPVAGPVPESEEEGEGEAEVEGIRSSPLVRRIAKENGIDLAALAGKGTGISGRITKRDILSYIEQEGAKAKAAPVAPAPSRPSAAAPTAPPMKFTGDVERVPLTQMRRAI